ncbi:MAG: DUF1345 domain-containing protein [Bacteroidetes bacterium]|nr:DUF1345 domain-containing protein [Bacteroidota bacterium]
MQKALNKVPFLERSNSLHKLLFCTAIGIICYLFSLFLHIDLLTQVMIGWLTFSLSFIILGWTIFTITSPQQIRNQAKIQDPNRSLVLLLVVVATCASFLAVILLMSTKKQNNQSENYHMAIAIASMISSWLLIHTIFTLRYAHLYYEDHKTNKDSAAEGLEFPGNEQPDYFDFAYFSFVLGMTFQVSDVQISSKRIRHLALFHGLLSFSFSTIMIALTINVLGNL